MKLKYVLVAVIACSGLAADAVADHGSTSNCPKERKRECRVMGLKSSNQYATQAQVACFKTQDQALNAGFRAPVDTSAATVNSCPSNLLLTMRGTEEVPPNNSLATGACAGTVNPEQTNVTVTCVHTVADVAAAHIHRGAPGVAGPIVCPAPTATSPFTISCELNDELRAELAAGNLYVNVHSPTFPEGEVRGQIPAPQGTIAVSGDVSDTQGQQQQTQQQQAQQQQAQLPY